MLWEAGYTRTAQKKGMEGWYEGGEVRWSEVGRGQKRWGVGGAEWCHECMANRSVSEGNRCGVAKRGKSAGREVSGASGRLGRGTGGQGCGGTGGGCTFVVFSDPPHELIHARPLDHEHVVHHALDRDRNDVVGAVHRLRSYGDMWVGVGGGGD